MITSQTMGTSLTAVGVGGAAEERAVRLVRAAATRHRAGVDPESLRSAGADPADVDALVHFLAAAVDN